VWLYQPLHPAVAERLPQAGDHLARQDAGTQVALDGLIADRLMQGT
jgi:hypothetical protein